jgi:CRP-like cAMP-binding protein
MLDQSDLLVGTGKLFVRNFMDIAVKTSQDKGDIIFRERDPALCFYTMISGKVNLYISTGHNIYTISTPGEVFGWSSIVGRNIYSATAECMAPSLLLRIDKDAFHRLLEEHPKCSIIFYKNFSKTLGSRLLASYDFISSALPPS